MAAYRLFLKASAAKEIEALGSKQERSRIVERIRALAADARPHGSEKLAGAGDRFRVRVGNYRIVYHVDDAGREITVFEVGHRRDVFRRK